MMKSVKIILGTAALLLATACTNLAGPPAHLYALSALPADGQAQMKTEPVIVIEEFSANRSLNTDRMPVMAVGNEIQYIGGSRFADRIPALLQSVLAQSVENVAGYPAISGQASGLYSQYLLRGTIRRFEVDVTGADTGKQVVIDLGVRIVDFRSSRLLSVKHFTVRQPVGAMDAATVAAAFDEATANLLGEVVSWADQQISGEEAASKAP